ncbi:putative 3-hydroxyphenylpropionic transporter MhpT [Candidatus Izimaplasma bacterium HR1]|jgi:DHA1 family multidrug resistance protein-like MFS transporter|uniref:MFS transporter n=1 Tax=Candidatus Izimoplasma sp. HR1 TaxID=1541959 RepID=UPI0004F63B13|nr:putative 3-hydroxyphenylpropionic transporter MhpT [Candidatus Izimaplasma bacterium HR1]
MKNLRTELQNGIKFVSTTPKVVVFMFIIYFMQGFIHNLGHPVTPALVSDRGIPSEYFGYFFAAMSFGLLVGAPFWGYLGDKGYKRLYIFFGLLVYSFGQYMFAFANDRNIMILYRFISGFGVSASITLIMSHLIEHSPLDRRKIYLGWYQALFVLGSSAGYWFAGQLVSVDFLISLLNTNDYRNIFLIQAIANVVHACYIFILIGKSKKVAKEDRAKKPNIIEGFKAISKLNKNLVVFMISLTFISLGTITISKFIEVYMNDTGLSPKNIGDFVGLTGIISLIATIVLVPFVARLKKDFPIMIIIQALSAIIIFIVFRQEDIMIALYTGFMLYVVLKAIYTPLEQHYISTHANDNNLGTVMGVRQSFFAVGLVAGPLLGGWLYKVKPLYAFDFSAAMLVLGFILILIVGRNIRINGNTSKNLEE